MSYPDAMTGNTLPVMRKSLRPLEDFTPAELHRVEEVVAAAAGDLAEQRMFLAMLGVDTLLAAAR